MPQIRPLFVAKELKKTRHTFSYQWKTILWPLFGLGSWQMAKAHTHTGSCGQNTQQLRKDWQKRTKDRAPKNGRHLYCCLLPIALKLNPNSDK